MTIDLLSKLISLFMLIVITSLVIWGVHGGAIISGLADKMEGFPSAFKKLFFDCPVCMSTFFTPIVWVSLGLNAGILQFQFVIFGWLGTAGLNYIIKEYLYPEQE